MSQRNSSSAQIDAMVVDAFQRATEAILLDRRATLRPITSRDLPDAQEYIRTVLGSWKTSLHTPLTLDLYLHLPRSNEHVLLERWQFEYILQSDLKDTRTFAMINRRMQTLLRSLYCFVRLLPGFNILHQCTAKPLVSFQLYAEQRAIPSNFKQETSRYPFAKVSTSKGLVAISVTFLNSTPVKVRFFPLLLSVRVCLYLYYHVVVIVVHTGAHQVHQQPLRHLQCRQQRLDSSAHSTRLDRRVAHTAHSHRRIRIRYFFKNV